MNLKKLSHRTALALAYTMIPGLIAGLILGVYNPLLSGLVLTVYGHMWLFHHDLRVRLGAEIDWPMAAPFATFFYVLYLVWPQLDPSRGDHLLMAVFTFLSFTVVIVHSFSILKQHRENVRESKAWKEGEYGRRMNAAVNHDLLMASVIDEYNQHDERKS